MMQAYNTPRGKIIIRDARLTDAVPFRELRLEALRDSPIAFSADYQKHVSEPLQSWENRLSMDPEESIIFFAEHETNLIGMSGIVRGGSPKTRHAATVWGVFVKPEWRGLHIAEEIIKACLNWARTRKIVIARLGVVTVNTSAVRCYERCGFRIHGTEPDALFYDSKYYDYYMMSCSLDMEPESK